MATDATARIRNLSIALEALSKAPSCENLAADVWILLTDEIRKYTEKKRPQPPARPAIFTSASDDDIPD